MRYSILILSFLLSSPHIFAQLSHNDTACIRMRNLAEKDKYNKELKYYTFGIAGEYKLPFGEEVNELLRKEYNIEVIPAGCIMDERLKCYNKQVAQIAARIRPIPVRDTTMKNPPPPSHQR